MCYAPTTPAPAQTLGAWRALTGRNAESDSRAKRQQAPKNSQDSGSSPLHRRFWGSPTRKSSPEPADNAGAEEQEKPQSSEGGSLFETSPSISSSEQPTVTSPSSMEGQMSDVVAPESVFNEWKKLLRAHKISGNAHQNMIDAVDAEGDEAEGWDDNSPRGLSCAEWEYETESDSEYEESTEVTELVGLKDDADGCDGRTSKIFEQRQRWLGSRHGSLIERPQHLQGLLSKSMVPVQ